MPRLRVHNFAVSLDGYAAGPAQDLDNPLGVGGEQLHEFLFVDPLHPVDAEFMARGDAGIGATIMGRNMFGPVRGPWGLEEWRGWWGDDPPYHHHVFVLTHYPRDSIVMAGGTIFYFVHDDIETVLATAFEAAGGQDVRLGGGTSVVQQYLRAGLVDEMHLAIVPILLGDGERLLDGFADLRETFDEVELVSSAAASHVVLRRSS